jgi:hypothetical protein
MSWSLSGSAVLPSLNLPLCSSPKIAAPVVFAVVGQPDPVKMRQYKNNSLSGIYFIDKYIPLRNNKSMATTSTICGLTREALTDAGVSRPTRTIDAARKQARANNCAVMYRGSHSWRTAMPTDMSTGDLNLYYSGSYEGVLSDLQADGWKVEVAL